MQDDAVGHEMPVSGVRLAGPLTAAVCHAEPSHRSASGDDLTAPTPTVAPPSAQQSLLEPQSTAWRNASARAGAGMLTICHELPER